MDDTAAGPRIRELRQRLTLLGARQAELEADLANQPTTPPLSTIARIRRQLNQIINCGTEVERKAAVEALIAEVRVTKDGIIPMLKIPDEHTMLPETGRDEDNRNNGSTVRIMVRSVGRAGLEPATEGL